MAALNSIYGIEMDGEKNDSESEYNFLKILIVEIFEAEFEFLSR